MVNVEIDAEKLKRIIIGCIHKSPGSCLKTFSNKKVNMFNKLMVQNLVKSYFGHYVKFCESRI